MADDFKDISHLYKVTPSAKTIIDGEDLVETKQKSKAYAWCDVLQSVTGLILGLFLFCHMGFTSSILLGKDTFWSLVSLTGGYFIDGVDHLWMHSVFGCYSRDSCSPQVPEQLQSLPHHARPLQTAPSH